MAKRKQLWNPDYIREKIQASQLVNRLEKHALYVDDPESENYEDVKRKTLMSDSQVRAAFGLLDKVIPNLKAVEHSGTGDNGEIIFKTVYEAPK